MITVELKGIKENFISLIVKGHANSDEYGKDLICAAVSAILTGGFNAINDKHSFEMILEDGNAQLIKKEGQEVSKHDQVVIETILTSLQTISESYPSYVKIKIKWEEIKDDVI